MTKKGAIIFLFISLLGCVVTYSMMLSFVNRPAIEYEFGLAPEFSLIDSNGNPFHSKMLKGKVWVADFFFTACPGPCPHMTGNMHFLHNWFEDGDDVRLVNFTVSPLSDTPEVLTKYAKRYQADTTRWHFLTGPGEDIARVASQGFKLGDKDNMILHSPKFAVVDRKGVIRGYYMGTDHEQTKNLATAIKELLAE